MRRLWLVPVVLLPLHYAIAQQAPAAPSNDGLQLLARVAQHYADAKSYLIESTEEENRSNPYSRDWQKTILIAAEAPGGRYRFEGRGPAGSAIKVSDGKTVWREHVDEDRYTLEPVSADQGTAGGPVPMVEMAMMNARFVKDRLAGMAKDLKSAELLPEATLDIAGKPVICLVVHLRNADLKRPNPNLVAEKTIWIDKQREVVLKTEEHTTGRIFINSPVTQEQTIVTSYTNTVLNDPIPDSAFTFVPPKSSHLIAAFPDAMEGMGTQSMAGDTVPSLKFKAADGKTVAIESFRGKPVLIDFWATWCAPCVAAMPKLAALYNEGKDKGLVLISVDQDEDPAKAADLLAKKGYAWPNFHDGDGAIEKLMGSSPIPRLVLVDPQGRIVYDGAGADENRLRKHISQLGPEFRDLAPKAPQPAPCVAAK